MAIEFDLNHALFLTYVGVGAAFLVLGSLVVFTSLIGWWGNWRLNRAQALVAESAPQVGHQDVETNPGSEAEPTDPYLAAAIGAAVALAIEAHRREQAEEGLRPENPATDGSGWRDQGRMVAFDARRIRERDR